jgi:hypothetical protein
MVNVTTTLRKLVEVLWVGFITVWQVEGNDRTNLLAGLTLGSLVGRLLLSGLALLEKGLRDQDLVLGRDATVDDLLVGPLGACLKGSWLRAKNCGAVVWL